MDESPALRLVSSKSNPGGSAGEPRRPEARRRRPATARPVEPTPAEPPPAEAPPVETASAAPGPAADSEPEGSERAGTDPTPQPSVDPDLGETTAGVAPPEQPAGSPPSVVPSAWQRQLAIALDFWRRRLTGEYEVDDFGFDPDLTANVLVPLLRPVYRTWFRTEVIGDPQPATRGRGSSRRKPCGRAVGHRRCDDGDCRARDTPGSPVSSHARSGPGVHDARCSARWPARPAPRSRATPTPSAYSIRENWSASGRRASRASASRSASATSSSGSVAAVSCQPRCAPACRSFRSPIVGSEEVYPVLGNAKTLARVLNLPYFPLTPTFPWLGPLGLVPLPVKWYIEFGEPIATADYGAHGADDPMLVFELTDRVREIIQSTLYRLLMQRRSVWR